MKTNLCTLFIGLLSLSLILGGHEAAAKTKFNCYSFPGVPAQTYNVGGINCPAGASESLQKKGNGSTKVICLYQAVCQVLAPGEKPTALVDSEVSSYATNTTALGASDFRASLIGCQGDGILANGAVVSSSCPSAADCQRDVLYNFSPATSLPEMDTKQVDVQPKDISLKSKEGTP